MAKTVNTAMYQELARVEAAQGKARTASTIVRIDGDAAPYIAMLAQKFPKAFQSALKSLGFWIRGEIQRGMSTEHPGSVAWPKLSRVTQTRVLDAIRGRGRTRKGKRIKGYYPPKTLKYSRLKAGGEKLQRAIRYKYRPGQVSIGWITPSAARSGRLFQLRFTRPVTARMRRFFNVAKLKLGQKAILHPDRPLIKPVFDALQPQIGDQLIRRVENKIGLFQLQGAQDAFASYRRASA